VLQDSQAVGKGHVGGRHWRHQIWHSDGPRELRTRVRDRGA
jgi:hypothetical protein